MLNKLATIGPQRRVTQNNVLLLPTDNEVSVINSRVFTAIASPSSPKCNFLSYDNYSTQKYRAVVVKDWVGIWSWAKPFLTQRYRASHKWKSPTATLITKVYTLSIIGRVCRGRHLWSQCACHKYRSEIRYQSRENSRQAQSSTWNSSCWVIGQLSNSIWVQITHQNGVTP